MPKASSKTRNKPALPDNMITVRGHNIPKPRTINDGVAYWYRNPYSGNKFQVKDIKVAAACEAIINWQCGAWGKQDHAGYERNLDLKEFVVEADHDLYYGLID